MATVAQPTLNELLERDRADAWEHFDRLAAIYSRELRRIARAAVVKLHRAQMLRPLTAAGQPADWVIPDPDELIDSVKAAGELAGKTHALREQVAEASVGGTLAAYGLSFNLHNPVIQNVITQMGLHITNIVEEQRRVIMQSLQDSWDQGLSIGEAAKKMLRDSVIDSKARGELIARTELTGATNGGSLAAVRLVNDASPADAQLRKIWIATNDDRTRETHSAASDDYGPGSGIAVTEPFIVGGAEMDHPGDPSGPPEEVINCRCSIGYEQGTGVPPPVAPPAEATTGAERTPAQLSHELIGQARTAEPQVTNDLQSIVRANGGTMGGLEFRLKTETSLTGKLQRKAAEKGITPEAYSQSVADVLRYTGVFEPADYATGVEKTITRLRKAGYEIDDSDVENYWNTGDDYNGINATARTPSGYRFELQFHTPESLDLKNGALHQLYEQFRDESNAHERMRLWKEMVSLSNSIDQPSEDVLKIGTRTVHKPPELPTTPEDLATSLIDAAKSREAHVTSDLSDAVTAVGGKMEGLDFRLKSHDSLVRKLTTKGPLDPVAYSQQVADVLRYTATFPDADYASGVEDAIRTLRSEGYHIDDADVENYWKLGDDYNGININLATPGGYRFELQFHTPESFALKNGELHRIYSEFRTSTDPFIRKQLWDQMVGLSDGLQTRMDMEVLVNVRKIGTLLAHEPPVATTIREIDAVTHADKVLEGDALNALSRYTGISYDDMNAYLRTGDLKIDRRLGTYEYLGGHTPEDVLAEPALAGARTDRINVVKLWINDLEDSFLPSEKPFLAYRGFRKAVLTDKYGANDDLTNLVGKTISDKGFVSVSADRNIAEQFGTSDKVVMELAVPKGMPTLNVSRDGSGLSFEDEIILPPGSKFLIQSVRQEHTPLRGTVYVVRAIVEPPDA